MATAPPPPVFLGFPGFSDGRESTGNVGHRGSIPGLRRCPGGGHGNPLQYSCLENPMNRGAWWAAVHRVTESDSTEHRSSSSCRRVRIWRWSSSLLSPRSLVMGRSLHPLGTTLPSEHPPLGAADLSGLALRLPPQRPLPFPERPLCPRQHCWNLQTAVSLPHNVPASCGTAPLPGAPFPFPCGFWLPHRVSLLYV